MRREIVQQIDGPNGNWTTQFGPETVRTLEDLGLIKKVGSSEVTYPDKVVEIIRYKKA